MAGRHSRKPYSHQIRQRVLDAYHCGDDWKAAALALGVPSHTANRWIRCVIAGEVPRKHGGHKKRILSESDIDVLVEWINEEPTVTLKALQTRLQSDLSKQVSLSTIRNYLDGRLITLKKLYPICETMNSEVNKERRKQFVQELQQHLSADKMVIWIDETNFNLFTCRTRGRSVRGTKARAVVANSRGSNLHIVGAISKNGLLQYSLKRGSFTKECCKSWLRMVLNNLSEEDRHKAVVVCDNAPCHTDLELVIEETAFSGGRLPRLAPYSPALNPIEGVPVNFPGVDLLPGDRLRELEYADDMAIICDSSSQDAECPV